MIHELTLSAPDGALLFLHTLYKHPDDAYISADAYVALRRYPKGTHFTTPAGSKVVHLENQQPLFAGFHAYPGDPQHFGQLDTPALFLQTGVTDG